MNRTMPLTLSGSSRLGLLVAGLLAAVTGVLVFAALRGSADDGAVVSLAGGNTRTIVVAKQDIAPRTVITGDMLQLTEVPSAAILSGAHAGSELLVGQVASVPILKGEQVLDAKLAADKAPLGLPYLVPKDRRAMAVEADKVVGAGGLIRPGDRVDVIGVVEVKYTSVTTGRELNQTNAVVLAQNVEVLAVEQKLQNRVTGTTAVSSEGRTEALVDQPEAQPDAKVVTLALAPTEAQDILLVEVKGTIRLMVRAPGDATADPAGDRTFSDLLDEETRARFERTLNAATR